MTTQPVQLFDQQGALATADAAAVARATQEIQAALVIAKRFERDEVRCKAKILEACKRKELAEVAEYEYSRGGTRITGATIDLLRAVANRWGNIRYGWAEVERKNGTSQVRCFAWDMQTNGQAERTFVVKHWRDTSNGGYALEDERDIYEMLANQAARRVRACLEEVIDSDIVSAAVDECRKTLKTGEKVPLKDRAVQMVAAFAEFGITQTAIETKLGNKLEAVSENQLASLRRIYKAIKDGVGRREDYFKPEAETTKPEFGKPEKAPDDDGDLAPQTQTTNTQPPQTAQPEKQPGASESERQVKTDSAQAPAAAPPPQEQPKSNLPKAIKGLLNLSRHTEPELMSWLATIGKVDDSIGTLRDADQVARDVLQWCHDNWQQVDKELKAAKGGK